MKAHRAKDQVSESEGTAIVTGAHVAAEGRDPIVPDGGISNAEKVRFEPPCVRTALGLKR
jgi:hypothetical protein